VLQHADAKAGAAVPAKFVQSARAVIFRPAQGGLVGVLALPLQP